MNQKSHRILNHVLTILIATFLYITFLEALQNLTKDPTTYAILSYTALAIHLITSIRALIHIGITLHTPPPTPHRSHPVK